MSNCPILCDECKMKWDKHYWNGEYCINWRLFFFLNLNEMNAIQVTIIVSMNIETSGNFGLQVWEGNKSIKGNNQF